MRQSVCDTVRVDRTDLQRNMLLRSANPARKRYSVSLMPGPDFRQAFPEEEPADVCKIPAVQNTCRLIGGVHGELRETDVRGADGELGAGDVAERGASGEIRAVVEELHGHPCPAAELLHDGTGDGIGGIFLIRAVFDDDAAVEDRPMRGVLELRMIGMHSVGIVGGDQKAPCDAAAEVLLGPAKGSTDAPERCPKEGGVCPLPCHAADLFAVKGTIDRKRVRRGSGIRRAGSTVLRCGGRTGGEEPCKRGISALQVIQTAAGEEFAVQPRAGCLLPVVEEEIHVDQVLRRGMGRLGDETAEQTGIRLLFILSVCGRSLRDVTGGSRIGKEIPGALLQAGQKGPEILPHIPMIAVVDRTVHVDGNARNDEKVAVDVDEALGNAAPRADQNTPGDRKRTVQPGGQDHAAVFLDIERDVLILDSDFRIALDAEGGRIEVTRHNMEGSRQQFSGIACCALRGKGCEGSCYRFPEGTGGKAEGNERGAAAQHIVAAARDKVPGILLTKRLKAGRPELPRDVVCGNQGNRAIVQKGHEATGEGIYALPVRESVIGRYSRHVRLLSCGKSGVGNAFIRVSPMEIRSHLRKKAALCQEGLEKETNMVSIILPTCNRAASLPRAIESILRQTYPDYELLVIDDGSTDSTREVVESYPDPRIRYFYNDGPVHGASRARNIGIREARGEYIAFEDSDDVWLPDKLERQVRYLEETKADVVYCRMHWENSDICVPSPSQKSLDLANLLKGSYTGTPAIIGRARCLKDNLFDESLRRNVDWELMIRLTAYYRAIYEDEDLVEVHPTPGSITSDSEAAVASIEYIREKHHGLYEEHPSSLRAVNRKLLYHRALLWDERCTAALSGDRRLRTQAAHVAARVLRKTCALLILRD